MKDRRAQVGLERRDLNGAEATVDDSGKIRGTAIVFNTWATIGHGPMSFRERVAPGAVTKTLAESDVIYLDNHDTSKPLARISAGNLDIRVEGSAVHYLADPPDTTYANDLKKNVRAKIVRGNSFGFETVKDKWDIGDDGVDERTLLEIKLPEISACTFPAYEATDIGMRSQYEAAMECRDRFYSARGGDAPGDGSKPYGNVTYADPGYQSDKKKRYPLDTKKHVTAAWDYISKAANAAKYSSSQLASIKSKIKSAAKKFGVTISSDRSMRDFDLRLYDPEYGFRAAPVVTVTGSDYTDMAAGLITAYNELSEDERAALPESLRALYESELEARAPIPGGGQEEDTDPDLDDDEEHEHDETCEDSCGLVSHTTQAGATVPLREAERLYELVRSMPATKATNEALGLLEPLLTSTPEEPEQRGKPKPDSSTSDIGIDSEEGLELQRRMRALKDAHRV